MPEGFVYVLHIQRLVQELWVSMVLDFRHAASLFESNSWTEHAFREA